MASHDSHQLHDPTKGKCRIRSATRVGSHTIDFSTKVTTGDYTLHLNFSNHSRKLRLLVSAGSKVEKPTYRQQKSPQYNIR